MTVSQVQYGVYTGAPEGRWETPDVLQIQGRISQAFYTLNRPGGLLVPPARSSPLVGGGQGLVQTIAYCIPVEPCCDLTVNLPNFKPTTRTYIPPRYPVAGSAHQDVYEFPRLWGSVASDGQLSLTYDNMPPEYAAIFLDAYNDTISGYLPFTLTEDYTSGITDPGLRNRILSPELLSWRFERPPVITPSGVHLYNVQVSFKATLIR